MGPRAARTGWLAALLLLALVGGWVRGGEAAADPVDEKKTRIAARRPEPEPALTREDLDKITQVMRTLGAALEGGRSGEVMKLFHAPDDESELRLADLRASLDREFDAERYTAVTVQNIEADDQLSKRRHTVWVNMQVTRIRKHGGSGVERMQQVNELFVVHQHKNGTFSLVSSPFFDVLGRERSVDLVADSILAVISIFALLGFTVWMGFEAYWLRPRRRLWRWLVLVPLLGPLGFFLVVYLPKVRTRPVPSAG